MVLARAQMACLSSSRASRATVLTVLFRYVTSTCGYVVQRPGEEPRTSARRGYVLHCHLDGVGFLDLKVQRLDESHGNTVDGCNAHCYRRLGAAVPDSPPPRPLLAGSLAAVVAARRI